MASLQEQLLKAGLADEKKAKQIKKEQRQAKKANKGKPQVNESRLAAEKALAEKAQRDRELGRQRQAEADKKAIYAQIVQLVNTSRIDRKGGEVAYQFTDGKKIKKLYVTAAQQNQLTKGMIAISKLGEELSLIHI